MSVEQNKTILRRSIEDVWGKGQTALLSQLFTSDVCDHHPLPGQPRGREGQQWIVETFRRAFPDIRVTVDVVIGEGDLVASHWTATGTNTGELMGMPPTNKHVTAAVTNMVRVSGGKISEVWGLGDLLGLQQQLGHAPIPKGIPKEAGRPMQVRSGGEMGRGAVMPDQKRDLIRRAYQEFVDKHSLVNVDKFLTPDYVGYFSAYPTIYGPEEFKKYLGMYNQAMPDSRAHIEQIIIDGDYGAVRVRFSGRHTGKLGELEPTHKAVDTLSVGLVHFVGDRIDKQWATNDDIGMMQQLGVIPLPELEAVPC